MERAARVWNYGWTDAWIWNGWMYVCVCMCPLVRLSCHVCCLSSSSYPASSCSSYVQGPCQPIGMSGQCRCTADGGRDGSAAAGMETPGPTAHALCSWECNVGCRLVVSVVRPSLGHRRVDGVWIHERLDGRGCHWLWVGCFPPVATGMGRGSAVWVGCRFPT